MANKVWIGTDGNYASASNWSPSGVPVAADNVRIPAGAALIAAGLNQSAVALGDFIVEKGCAALIGATGAYLQISCARFEFEGTGVAWIDIGSSAISPIVKTTTFAAEGSFGLYLKGSAIATLSVNDGLVGLAMRYGDTATVNTVRVTGKKAKCVMGSGVTLTTGYTSGGTLELHCAATTVTGEGGNVTTEETGAITTLNANGQGTYKLNATGTITTLNQNDSASVVDFTQSGASRTVTTYNHHLGTRRFDKNVVTFTTDVSPTSADGPIQETAIAI